MDSSYLEALALARGLPTSPKSIGQVARATSDEAARWAFSQWELRRRARVKFELADDMLFTREALEQASHPAIAQYRALKLGGHGVVADLTCGIGGDLIELARQGTAVGFELDPERAEYARWNLRVHGLEAEVREQDSLRAEWDFARCYADPSRRVMGRRTRDPGQFAPDPGALRERMKGQDLAAIKLSPMLPDTYLEELGGRREYVSADGECREVLIWFGAAEDGMWAVRPDVDEPLAGGTYAPEGVPEPDAFLFEADPAAIRADALGTLCDLHGILPLGDSYGYLTGPDPVSSPWLKRFRVVESGSFDLKAIRRRLMAHDSATPTLKQRGAGQDLQALYKALKLGGERRLAVVLFKVGKSIRYSVIEAT